MTDLQDCVSEIVIGQILERIDNKETARAERLVKEVNWLVKKTFTAETELDQVKARWRVAWWLHTHQDIYKALTAKNKVDSKYCKMVSKCGDFENKKELLRNIESLETFK